MSSLPSFLDKRDVPALRSESDIRSLRRSVQDLVADPKAPGSYKELVNRFREENPDLYANALEHLEEAYCLDEVDMEGYSYAFYTLLFCPEGRAEFYRLLRTDDNLLPLLHKSVTKAVCLVTGKPAGIDLIDRVFKGVQESLNSRFTSMRNFIRPFLSSVRENADRTRDIVIRKRRKEAVQQMEIKYADFFRQLPQNGFALTDTQMSADFASRNSSGSRYLNTYFDTAQFGIRNVHLVEAADGVARTADLAWDPFVKQMKFQATSALEQTNNRIPRRFKPRSVSFHPNGTMAFAAYMTHCMTPGERVLASSEEYGELLLLMSRYGIKVSQLPALRDVESYREEVCNALRGSAFDYLLISETSRYGTVFPLEDISAARNLTSPNTRLIIDSCQSAGRTEHDMARCRPDAVIVSTNKGSEFGQGLGMVALADDYRYPEDRRVVADSGLHDYPGTVYHEAMARTAYAMNPEGLPICEERAFYSLTPKEREDAIRLVARNCVAMVREINSRYRQGPGGVDRIQIIRPADVSHLAHAIELKVEGLPRQKLCDLAKSFGVHIADFYFDPHDDESVRIAFHPWMGNDALKILGYVLDRSASFQASSNSTVMA